MFIPRLIKPYAFCSERGRVVPQELILLLAVFALCAAQVSEASSPMETLVNKALNSRGREYFETERAYRLSGGLPPDPELPSPNADPLSTLILHVLRQWKQPEAEEYDRALGYLDTLPAQLAPTPITGPSPSGVAAYLSLHFGSRVADLMAVHLIKQTDWPSWRVSGVLLYLREEARPSITPALIRFASETREQRWGAVALEAIRAANDPDLSVKVYAEELRAAKENRPMPSTLQELMKRK